MCTHHYKCPDCGYKWNQDFTHSTEFSPNCRKYTNPLMPGRRFCGGSNGCVGKAASYIETNTESGPFDALLSLYNADVLRTTYDKSAYTIDQDRLNEYKKHLATMNRAQLTAPPKPEEIEMNTPLLETRTLVDGVDINKANKERLILMLKTLEKEEDDLAKIRTESKTITARIAEIAAARSAVATALDA